MDGLLLEVPNEALQPQETVIGSFGALHSAFELIRQLTWDPRLLVAAVHQITIRARPKLQGKLDDLIHCEPVYEEDLPSEACCVGEEFVRRVLASFPQQDSDRNPERYPIVGFWILDGRIVGSAKTRLFADARGVQYALLDYDNWLRGRPSIEPDIATTLQPTHVTEDQVATELTVARRQGQQTMTMVSGPRHQHVTVAIVRGETMQLFRTEYHSDQFIAEIVPVLPRHLLTVEERLALFGKRTAQLVYANR